MAGVDAPINRGQSNDETNFVWPNPGHQQIRACLIGPTVAEAVKFGTIEPEYDRFFILTSRPERGTLQKLLFS
jgi:hypothetical protein